MGDNMNGSMGSNMNASNPSAQSCSAIWNNNNPNDFSKSWNNSWNSGTSGKGSKGSQQWGNNYDSSYGGGARGSYNSKDGGYSKDGYNSSKDGGYNSKDGYNSSKDSTHYSSKDSTHYSSKDGGGYSSKDGGGYSSKDGGGYSSKDGGGYSSKDGGYKDTRRLSSQPSYTAERSSYTAGPRNSRLGSRSGSATGSRGPESGVPRCWTDAPARLSSAGSAVTSGRDRDHSFSGMPQPQGYSISQYADAVRGGNKGKNERMDKTNSSRTKLSGSGGPPPSWTCQTTSQQASKGGPHPSKSGGGSSSYGATTGVNSSWGAPDQQQSSRGSDHQQSSSWTKGKPEKGTGPPGGKYGTGAKVGSSPWGGKSDKSNSWTAPSPHRRPSQQQIVPSTTEEPVVGEMQPGTHPELEYHQPDAGVFDGSVSAEPGNQLPPFQCSPGAQQDSLQSSHHNLSNIQESPARADRAESTPVAQQESPWNATSSSADKLLEQSYPQDDWSITGGISSDHAVDMSGSNSWSTLGYNGSPDAGTAAFGPGQYVRQVQVGASFAPEGTISTHHQNLSSGQVAVGGGPADGSTTFPAVVQDGVGAAVVQDGGALGAAIPSAEFAAAPGWGTPPRPFKEGCSGSGSDVALDRPPALDHPLLDHQESSIENPESGVMFPPMSSTSTQSSAAVSRQESNSDRIVEELERNSHRSSAARVERMNDCQRKIQKFTKKLREADRLLQKSERNEGRALNEAEVAKLKDRGLYKRLVTRYQAKLERVATVSDTEEESSEEEAEGEVRRGGSYVLFGRRGRVFVDREFVGVGEGGGQEDI